MNETKSQPGEGKSLVETLDDLFWEEVPYLLLGLNDEQQLRLFQQIRPRRNIEMDKAEIVAELCAFWVEALGFFRDLTVADREAWLRDARNCGSVEARFANTLLELQPSKIHTSPPEEITP